MITAEIHEAGLDGVFARADGDQPLQGVLALGGSDGGVPAYWARLLAQERFASLALAYFNTPNTQPALTEVPLERLERALRWLREQPGVATNNGRIALIGVSKGAELALLLAVTFPDLVGPVVAYTPSSVVWQGIDFSAPFPPLRSSWSFGGRPLPFVCFPEGVRPLQSQQGMRLLPIYDRGLDSVAGDAAVIPVERAVGPLLLVSGSDDQMWPAERMCRMLADRMRASGRESDVRHINFPEAGHVLFPYDAGGAGDSDERPMPYDLGGNPAAAQQAHAIAWPKVVKTLQGD